MRGTAGLSADNRREPPGTVAPGHTDLMVAPESIDAWLEANPLPSDVAGVIVEFIVWMLVAGVGATVVTLGVWWVRHV